MVSSVNCPTEKVSAYVDEIIKLIAQIQPSYVEDTPDFLRKLNKIQEENQEDSKKAKEVYLVSLDVDALYANIENNEGLKALQEKVEQNRHARPLGWAVVKLMELVLLLNNFVFNGINFLQIKGTSMEARCSPNYSNIYMAKWEEKVVYETAFWRYIRCWLRYIDDIFMIWVGSKQKLNEFLKYLNSVHQSIKCKYKVSSKKVDFLDTTVITNKDGRLITDVYQKPTDTHPYLNSNSEHLRHLKRNIPYSQAIRLKRICSDEKKLSQRLNDYSNYFVASCYKRKNVNKQMKRVHSMTRSSCLEKREKKTTTRIPFVLTYHSNLPPVGKIINDHWNILQTKPKLRRTYKERPLVAYRRPKSFRDLLVKAEFQWEKGQYVTLGSRPCGKCSLGRSMQNTKEFKAFQTAKLSKSCTVSTARANG